MFIRKYHSIYYTSDLFWGNTYYCGRIDEILGIKASSSGNIDNAITTLNGR